MGGETVVDYALTNPGHRIGVVAPTIGDCRRICFEGESGILACLPKEYEDAFNKSSLELAFPNGAKIYGYGADEPKRLRGPQFHFLWVEELASWKAKKVDGGQKEFAWDMAKLCLRLGDDPRGIITTTPKPIPHIKELIKDAACYVTRATTYDNRKNLAPGFFDDIIKRYEGTRLGRQELLAEVLEIMEGALWAQDLIDDLRVDVAPQMKRIVVAIDPAVTSEPDSNETGIVAVGAGVDEHGYVLADSSGIYKPTGWARKAIELYKHLEADCIVAEINNGGEMVANTIHMLDSNIRVVVVTATRGKAVRAEPITAIYEQRRFHHVGVFERLEEQMTNFSIGGEYGLKGSPDHMDALVWGATELLVNGISYGGMLEFYRMQAEIERETQAARNNASVSAGVGVSTPGRVPTLPRALGRDPEYIKRTLRNGR